MKKKVIFISGGLLALGGMFVLGYKLGEHHIIKSLIDQYENGNNSIAVSDSRTGLIYELSAECVGD